jgi:hypothetical protein
VKREITECATRLNRYLKNDEIVSGKAIAAAREYYRNVSRERQMMATLPEAWTQLVGEENDLLLEPVADRVESLCNFKPDPDTVARFLRENFALRSATLPKMPPPRPTSNPPRATTPPATPALGLSVIGFLLDGRQFPARNARDVLVKVFETLSARNNSFLERFAALPKHRRTRRYLDRTPEALYPGRADLARDHSAKLNSGWYLGTKVSRAAIERIIEMACDVAHLRFGYDFIANLGE